MQIPESFTEDKEKVNETLESMCASCINMLNFFLLKYMNLIKY